MVVSPDRAPAFLGSTGSRISSEPTFPLAFTQETAHSVTVGALYPWSSESFLIYKSGTNTRQKGPYMS